MLNFTYKLALSGDTIEQTNQTALPRVNDRVLISDQYFRVTDVLHHASAPAGFQASITVTINHIIDVEAEKA